MHWLNSSPRSSGTPQQSVHSSITGVVDGSIGPEQHVNVVINHKYCCKENKYMSLSHHMTKALIKVF